MDGLKNLLETEHSGLLDSTLYVDSQEKKKKKLYLPFQTCYSITCWKGFPDMSAQR